MIQLKNVLEGYSQCPCLMVCSLRDALPSFNKMLQFQEEYLLMISQSDLSYTHWQHGRIQTMGIMLRD
jgi:hypothetical protein